MTALTRLVSLLRQAIAPPDVSKLGLEHFLYDKRRVNDETTPKILDALHTRYSESLTSLDRAVGLNITFAIFALYGYLSLQPDQSLTVPLIDLQIPRALWLRLVPAISFVLQVFVLTSALWVLLTRVNIKQLIVTGKNRDKFVDTTDILTGGVLGHFGILFVLRQLYRSRLHRVWLAPLVLVVVLIVTSPLTVCLYFIVQLALTGSYIIGTAYAVLLLVFVWLYAMLVTTIGALIGAEFGIAFSTGIDDLFDYFREEASGTPPSTSSSERARPSME